MSKEQWVVFKTNQHTQTLFQYKGLPHEKSWSESTSLSPEDSRLYNSYSDGSAAVESFIEDHTMTLECDPLQAEQRIRELKQHIRALEAINADLDKALENTIGYLDQSITEGCQVCFGDCASANPPQTFCPMLEMQRDYDQARAALAKARGDK